MSDEAAVIAIADPTSPPTVSAGTERPESKPNDSDAMLRATIKDAVDRGDDDRAAALLAVLRSSPKAAPVLALAGRRKRA